MRNLDRPQPGSNEDLRSICNEDHRQTWAPESVTEDDHRRMWNNLNKSPRLRSKRVMVLSTFNYETLKRQRNVY